MRHNPPRPDPDELRLVAAHAAAAVGDVDHVVAAARAAGVTVDDEVFEAAAVLRAWAGWLGRRAEQAAGGS